MLVFVTFVAVPMSTAGRADRSGFFTNLYYHDEGEDVLGYELYIVPTRSGYSGALLHCEGSCEPLHIIEPTFDQDRITFEYEEYDKMLVRFEGVIDSCGITGGFYYPHGEKPPLQRLKRKQTYWD